MRSNFQPITGMIEPILSCHWSRATLSWRKSANTEVQGQSLSLFPLSVIFQSQQISLFAVRPKTTGSRQKLCGKTVALICLLFLRDPRIVRFLQILRGPDRSPKKMEEFATEQNPYTCVPSCRMWQVSEYSLVCHSFSYFSLNLLQAPFWPHLAYTDTYLKTVARSSSIFHHGCRTSLS